MQRWSKGFRPTKSLWRGLLWTGGALAGLAAAAVAAIIAVVFAATMMVIGVMASVLLLLAATAVRARRQVRAQAGEANVIEARNVGGHSWVAYGWDGR